MAPGHCHDGTHPEKGRLQSDISERDNYQRRRAACDPAEESAEGMRMLADPETGVHEQEAAATVNLGKDVKIRFA